jgi:hypothetical protein
MARRRRVGRRRFRADNAGLSDRTLPPIDAAGAARIRRRACDDKARYGEHLAEVVAEEQSKASGETIESYRCLFAPPGDPHWHIGHPLRGSLRPSAGRIRRRT